MERLEEIWFNHRSKIIAAFIGLAVLMISGGNLFNERSNKMDESFMANKKVSQTQKQSQVQGKRQFVLILKEQLPILVFTGYREAPELMKH